MLWPLLFVAMKLATYYRLMRRLPTQEWLIFWRGKLKRLWGLMHHTEAAEHQDEFLYKDQVTYATFHAVARYDLKPFRGQVFNVIASKHPLTNSTDDTRLVFGESASGMSRTMYLPAKTRAASSSHRMCRNWPSSSRRFGRTRGRSSSEIRMMKERGRHRGRPNEDVEKGHQRGSRRAPWLNILE